MVTSCHEAPGHALLDYPLATPLNTLGETITLPRWWESMQTVDEHVQMLILLASFLAKKVESV